MDVIAGRGPSPRYVLEVVQGLPDTSLTSALARGGRQFHGWGVERYMMAELYDALNANTAATGQWKKGPPKFKPFPRPQTEELGKRRKVSVRDLHAGFTNRLNS